LLRLRPSPAAGLRANRLDPSGADSQDRDADPATAARRQVGHDPAAAALANRLAGGSQQHPDWITKKAPLKGPRATASSHRPIAGQPGSADRHGAIRARVARRLTPDRPYITQPSAMAFALKCRDRAAPRGSTVVVARHRRQR
jgi:hypothetical protein